MKKTSGKGVSLIEILVVVSVFAILGVLTTQSVIQTLRGARKSEALVRVRENLDYATGIIERQLKNANSLGTCTGTTIPYQDQYGNSTSFGCVGVGVTDPLNSYVASGSARLTSTDVRVTSCTITCPATGQIPSTVTITLTLQEATSEGVEGASATVTTRINLRTY